MRKDEDVILALVREFTHGSRQSQNPYGRNAVKDALRFLAEQHGIPQEDYLDAASIIEKRKEEETIA